MVSIRLSPDNPASKWATLAVYFVIVAHNAVQFINFAPIEVEVKAFFRMDALEVNFLPTVYAITYPAFIIVGCLVFQRYGLWPSIVIAGIFNATGAVLRVVCVLWYRRYPLLLLSQIINGTSEVFYLSLPPLLSGTWFTEKHRTFATAVAVMSNSIGTCLGFVIPPAVIPPGDGYTYADRETQFLRFFSIQALIAVTVATVAATLLPPHPSRPPSITAPHTDVHEILPVIKRIIRNPSFVILALSIGISGDVLWTVASMLPQLLIPFGLNEEQCGWIGFALTLSGAALGWVVALFIDRYRMYKKPLLAMLCCAATCFSGVILVLLYEPSPAAIFGAVLVLMTVMGACLNALIPVQLELGVELTYPLPEAISTAFLVCLSGILSPLLTISGTELVGNAPTRTTAIWFMVGCGIVSTVAAILIMFVRDDESVLNRLRIERSARVITPLEAVSPATSGGDDDFIQLIHEEHHRRVSTKPYVPTAPPRRECDDGIVQSE